MNKNTVKFIMIGLMIVMVGIYFVSGTYARYTSKATGNAEVNVAKWAVKINGIDATTADAKFDITFNEVENDNVVDGYIAPASQLYADFVINPEGSQVAMDYSFTLGEIKANNNTTVPESIKVLKVVPVVNNVESQTALTENGGAYSGTIELATENGAQTTALSQSDSVTLRVYVEWTDLNTDDANSTDTSVGVAAPALTMEVNATATQHIGE